jgi:homoserine dehydrogenase
VDIALLGNGTVANGLLTHIETLNKSDRALFSIRHILLKPDERCPSPLFTNTIDTILEDEKVEVVVEAMGGRHPAYDYLKAAILAKKHVVTSNKELVSVFGAELAGLAAENKVAFFFSAAVGGGIPLLMYLRDTARQETIHEFSGILNGTTNFILDAMTRKNLDFSDALKQAQLRGYAEADPTNDVQGYDLTYKLRIASCVAFGQWIDTKSILRLPLHHVSALDIEFFRRRNRTLRYLINAGFNEEGKLFATIQPTALADHRIEAQVLRNNNLFLCSSQRSGEQILIGQGAGASPTAANIHRDLQRILNGERVLIHGNEPEINADNGALKTRYYLRMSELAAQEFPSRDIMEAIPVEHQMILITHRMNGIELIDTIQALHVLDPDIFVCAIQEAKEGE